MRSFDRTAAGGRHHSPELETGGATIRFTLLGLTVFSVALVVTGGLLTSGLINLRAHAREGGSGSEASAGTAERLAAQEMPPWGDLVTSEIEVERPIEYVASELGREASPGWVFDSRSPEPVRATLLACGLTGSEVDRALAPGSFYQTATNLIVKPADDLVLSLAPPTRAKLYQELGRSPANHYMYFPFCFPGQSLEETFENSRLDSTIMETIRKLLYPRGGAQCFSDFELVMRRLPTEAERLSLLQTLSRQRALLVRLQIRPDTDIEKLLGYWGRGTPVKDARPLLESIQRLPSGGTLSLLYLLPRFARERLYTFPLPPKSSDPALDCHWSTMNFFAESPDDRFANPEYTVQYLKAHYYPVATPNLYGDVVLVLNQQGNAIHSAVHVADDILFTKNGNNYAQPWMLMRTKDLLASYSSDPAIHLAYYRDNRW